MDLSGLNEQQKQAVLHGPGPCCVLAGAGSGKTRVLTYRIARLIEEGIKPENVLAVTFTKKAAGEMVERLEAMLGQGAVEDLNIGTFHSVCYKILRTELRALGEKVPQVAEESWQKRTVKNILAARSESNPWGIDWDLDLAYALGWISYQKNHLRGVDDELIIPETQRFLEPKYRALYRRYEELKAAEDKLDFDDMLLWCYQLLRDNPAIKAKYQRQFQWILVDEFQDTNLAQYEILKLLAPPENNLFVVGDDYQSIYAWRGAKVSFIIHFAETWPEAAIIPLELNYRSTENIVNYSNKLISHNFNQYKKTCRAHREALADPVLMMAENEDQEAEVIAQEIQSLVEGENARYKYGDIAVLYRVNAYSRALEDAFIRAGIPYVIIGSVGFYERKEVKDVLAYLRAALGDQEAAKRIINVPNRYLGQVFVQAVERYALMKGCSFIEAVKNCPETRHKRYERGIREYLWILDCVREWIKGGTSPARLVADVRKLTRYDEWLIKEEGGEEGPDNPRLENLDALVQAASRFERVEDFLAYVDRAAGQANGQEVTGKVQMMTLHKSKGLEFPVVFMAGVSEGLLPHRKCVQYRDGEVIPESLEEERRLCYVGMTRAMDLLYLSSVESYQGKPTGPSVFLREIGLQELTEKVAC